MDICAVEIDLSIVGRVPALRGQQFNGIRDSVYIEIVAILEDGALRIAAVLMESNRHR